VGVRGEKRKTKRCSSAGRAGRGLRMTQIRGWDKEIVGKEKGETKKDVCCGARG